MILEVVSPILGFESVTHFEFKAIDQNFAQIKNANGESPSFSMINPFALREFVFEISDQLQEALGLYGNTNYLVFCIMVAKKPLHESLVNFLGPIIINTDNQKMAQVVLDDTIYTSYGAAEPLSSYIAQR